MKKIKEILLGTIYIWLPILACYIANAIANMITNGENEIIKLVCVDSKGNVGSPCGACREYMMQLSKNSKDIEILKDIDTKEIVKLEELIPDWWGKTRV